MKAQVTPVFKKKKTFHHENQLAVLQSYRYLTFRLKDLSISADAAIAIFSPYARARPDVENSPHQHDADNGSWQRRAWTRWKLAEHPSMHFHRRHTAFISAKRMFIVAVPPTTLHLIRPDRSFWKRGLKRSCLSQDADRALRIKRREATTYSTSRPGDSFPLHRVAGRESGLHTKQMHSQTLGHNHSKSTFRLWAECLQECGRSTSSVWGQFIIVTGDGGVS